jgi:predicted GNAT family acetyltransferase
VASEPVTTGLGLTIGTYVAIFSIATPPIHRGNGYAAAVTARAAADGLSAGADWAWLQASQDGLPVYERLGIRTLEAWSAGPSTTDRTRRSDVPRRERP